MLGELLGKQKEQATLPDVQEQSQCSIVVAELKEGQTTSRTWNKNNHSPRLSVPAAVVAKRTDISHSDAANAGDLSGAHGYRTSTYTSYYVTFQVESGDRMEFEVDGSDII